MVTIHPYDTRWPAQYQALAKELQELLGDQIQRIDHIGSTSIPGLAAKDRIDVQITLADFSKLDDKASQLTAHGFQLRALLHDHRPPWDQHSPPEQWEKRYIASRPPRRAANIHVRLQGRANQRYALLFRDFLRAHQDSAAAYQQAKQRLSSLCHNTSIYSEAKDPICDLIMAEAERWAARTQWAL